jgi:TPR repeat protein
VSANVLRHIHNLPLATATRRLKAMPPFRYAAILIIASCFQSSLANANEAQDVKAANSALQRKNYPLALKYFVPLAQQGNADAQNELGFMYHEGLGLPKDPLKAVYWYTKAAEQDHPSAQFNLGNRYRQGDGVTEDDAVAVAWWKKAASHDHRKSMFNLGYAYLDGRGVEENKAEAINWFRKSANRGYSFAQYNLIFVYSEGIGTEIDNVEAMKWCIVLSLRQPTPEDLDVKSQAEAACGGISVTDEDGARAKFLALHWIDKHPMQ